MGDILDSLGTGFDNLLSNPTQALGVATTINSLANGQSVSAPAATTTSSSSILLIVGAAIVGVLVLVLVLKK